MTPQDRTRLVEQLWRRMVKRIVCFFFGHDHAYCLQSIRRVYFFCGRCHGHEAIPLARHGRS